MLPFSRNNTYVAGISEVHADDLNAMQDELGLHKRLMSYTRFWDTDGAAVAADPIGDAVLDWAFAEAGDGSPSLSTGLIGQGSFQYLQLNGVGTTDDTGKVYRKWPLWADVDNTVAVLEFYAWLSLPVAGTFLLGLSTNPFTLTRLNAFDDTFHDYIWVGKESADSTWQAWCGNGEQAAVDAVDTGVTVQHETWHKIQIRHFGRNHAAGGTNGKIEIWIDGALAHTFDDAGASGFAMPDSSSIDAAATSAFNPTAILWATNANAGITLIGPVRAWWYALPVDAGI